MCDWKKAEMCTSGCVSEFKIPVFKSAVNGPVEFSRVETLTLRDMIRLLLHSSLGRTVSNLNLNLLFVCLFVVVFFFFK